MFYVADYEKFNKHYGDEDLITNLYEMGRLGEKIPGGPDLTDNDLRQARRSPVSANSSKI